MKERSVKIECVNISKTFHVPGQKQLLHVLNKVSLKVYENEFLVILGPGPERQDGAAQLHGRID